MSAKRKLWVLLTCIRALQMRGNMTLAKCCSQLSATSFQLRLPRHFNQSSLLASCTTKFSAEFHTKSSNKFTCNLHWASSPTTRLSKWANVRSQFLARQWPVSAQTTRGWSRTTWNNFCPNRTFCWTRTLNETLQGGAITFKSINQSV